MGRSIRFISVISTSRKPPGGRWGSTKCRSCLRVGRRIGAPRPPPPHTVSRWRRWPRRTGRDWSCPTSRWRLTVRPIPLATLDRLAAAGIDPARLFFITGADAFRDIATWKDYPAILDRTHFVVVSRPGCAAPLLRGLLPTLAGRMIETPCEIPSRPGIFLVDAPTAPVSSTDVRERRTRGESIDGLVAPAVKTYIERQNLYLA